MCLDSRVFYGNVFQDIALTKNSFHLLETGNGIDWNILKIKIKLKY